MKHFNATIRVSGKATTFETLSTGDLFIVNPIYGFGKIRIWPIVYVKINESSANALDGGCRSMMADDEVWFVSFRGITGEIK